MIHICWNMKFHILISPTSSSLVELLLFRTIAASASAPTARTSAPAPILAVPVPRTRPGPIAPGPLPLAPISVSISVAIAVVITPVPPIAPVPVPTPARFSLPANLVFDILLHTPDKGHGHWLDMHKVAKSTAAATILIIVATPRLAEVRHRAELHLQLASVVVASIENIERIGGLLLVKELAVDVADHVISEVVTDRERVDPPELGQLHEEAVVIVG